MDEEEVQDRESSKKGPDLFERGRKGKLKGKSIPNTQMDSARGEGNQSTNDKVFEVERI